MQRPCCKLSRYSPPRLCGVFTVIRSGRFWDCLAARRLARVSGAQHSSNKTRAILRFFRSKLPESFVGMKIHCAHVEIHFSYGYFHSSLCYTIGSLKKKDFFYTFIPKRVKILIVKAKVSEKEFIIWNKVGFHPSSKISEFHSATKLEFQFWENAHRLSGSSTSTD